MRPTGSPRYRQSEKGKTMDKRFWVIGGEYTDTRFNWSTGPSGVRPVRRLDRSYRRETRSICTARYTIVQEGSITRCSDTAAANFWQPGSFLYRLSGESPAKPDCPVPVAGHFSCGEASARWPVNGTAIVAHTGLAWSSTASQEVPGSMRRF